MAASQRAVQPISGSIRCSNGFVTSFRSLTFSSRSLSTTASSSAQAEPEAPKPKLFTRAADLDPNLVVTPRDERRVQKRGLAPIGSRRRRAVLASNPLQVPFEQLPYQCFQEARKVLAQDRKEKVEMIDTMRDRIGRLIAQDPAVSDGEMRKNNRLKSMQTHLEELKVRADYNDPLVKKKFEDGDGDMNKPIYRHLAEREWRKYRYLITKQRVEQFSIVPDLLPAFDPSAEVVLAWGRKIYQPGSFVPSNISERAPKLKMQVYDKGERLVTVIVVDSDVPNLEKDGFDYRCHYVAANIPISPTKTSLSLPVDPSPHIVLPWLPPSAQKGSPYHRLSIFVLEQDGSNPIDAAKVGKATKRHNFILRSFIDKHNLRPVGFSIFRTEWDESMKDVMQRAGISGWDQELKRKRIEPLPYKKKDGDRYR